MSGDHQRREKRISSLIVDCIKRHIHANPGFSHTNLVTPGAWGSICWVVPDILSKLGGMLNEFPG